MIVMKQQFPSETACVSVGFLSNLSVGSAVFNPPNWFLRDET